MGKGLRAGGERGEGRGARGEGCIFQGGSISCSSTTSLRSASLCGPAWSRAASWALSRSLMAWSGRGLGLASGLGLGVAERVRGAG